MDGAPVARVDRILEDLIPGYLEGRRRDLETLRAQLAARDYAGMLAVLHRIKGTGSAYGFIPVTETAKALETRIRAGDIDVAPELDALRAYLDAVTVTFVDT